jgi:hypothetical protein
LASGAICDASSFLQGSVKGRTQNLRGVAGTGLEIRSMASLPFPFDTVKSFLSRRCAACLYSSCWDVPSHTVALRCRIVAVRSRTVPGSRYRHNPATIGRST